MGGAYAKVWLSLYFSKENYNKIKRNLFGNFCCFGTSVWQNVFSEM